ncbi:hypothetical protein MRX96_033176 [Rhipicephalus microplus]
MLDGIGLVLSLTKTKDLVVHFRAAQRHDLPYPQLRGAPTAWPSCVRYLGLTIENRLRWLPAAKRIRQVTHRLQTCV